MEKMNAQIIAELAQKARQDFPIFRNNGSLIYLDSAATSQKPAQVIEAERAFYENFNSNVHRGIYKISEEATEAYEQARKLIAQFIGAHPREVIFTKNATEALNLAAACIARSRLNDKSHIVFTEMEHHSNIVPWHMAAAITGAKTSAVAVTDDGFLDEQSAEQNLENGADVFAFTHVSNVLGTINGAASLAEKARDAGALSVVDAAQSVPHMPVDMKRIGCDFLAFSGHKMLGPTGVGVLCARRELLEELPPFLGGGEMIKEVSSQGFVPADVPAKFEAGTPNAAGVIGLGEAVKYLLKLGMENVHMHERQLTKYALELLGGIRGLHLYGPLDAGAKCGVLAFNVEGIPPHDMASLLDSRGIAVRSGHHCAMPLHMRLGIEGSTRASFYIYNSENEVEALAEGIRHAKKVFGV